MNRNFLNFFGTNNFLLGRLVWLLPLAGLGLAIVTKNSGLFLSFTIGLLLISALALMYPPSQEKHRPSLLWIAWAGLAATLIGDYFLTVRHAHLDAVEFLCGVAGFALAHLCWITFLWYNYRLNLRVCTVLLISVGIFFWNRLWPAIPSDALRLALLVYLLLSIISVSLAVNATSRAFAFGIGLLFFSDLMIAGGDILKISALKPLIGITYCAALLAITRGIIASNAPRKTPAKAKFLYLRRSPILVLGGGGVAIFCFVAAMSCVPYEAYNPFTYMLSYLGRAQINGVAYPQCNYFFAAGMLISAVTIAYFIPALNCFVASPRRRTLVGWGLSLSVGGLITIVFMPEDITMFFHNIGCLLFCIGGVIAVLALSVGNSKSRMSCVARYAWSSAILAAIIVFGIFLWLQIRYKCPLTPYVATTQKLVIVSFMGWLGFYAVVLRQCIQKFVILY